MQLKFPFHRHNYRKYHIVKKEPQPKFEMNTFWVNYQKQHEFNPPHSHRGLYSFVIFMKIPTHWKEQHALSFSAHSNLPSASNFQFILDGGNGRIELIQIPLSPEDEGRMVFFPAWLLHQVFPFYGTEEERITISGNIEFEDSKEEQMKLGHPDLSHIFPKGRVFNPDSGTIE